MELKQNKNDLFLDSLEKDWQESCMNFSEALLASPDDLKPDPFNQQKLENQKRSLSNKISSHSLVGLIGDGILQISQSTIEEDRRLFSLLNESIENLQLSVDSPPLENLAEQLGIDITLLDSIEQRVLKELAEGKVNSPLLAILAFLESQKAQLWFYLAFSLYQEENYTFAAEVLSSILEMHSQPPEYSILLASCLVITENQEKASEIINEASKMIVNNNLILSDEWNDIYKKLKEKLLV
jgi:tetratricopeptide (TPR) repeat protein